MGGCTMERSHLVISGDIAIAEDINFNTSRSTLDLTRKEELDEDNINEKERKISCTASLSCSSEAEEEGERHSSVHVNFTKLEIREYELQLGDNPAVRKGPPISIGWDVVDRFEHDLDTYELTRGERRNFRDLKIPEKDRKQMLHQAGYSLNEMRKRIKQANIIKRRRLKTATMTATVENMTESYQSMKHSVEKVFCKKKREEETKWEELTLRYANEDSVRYGRFPQQTFWSI